MIAPGAADGKSFIRAGYGQKTGKSVGIRSRTR
jgi:hypothetical protein